MCERAKEIQDSHIFKEGDCFYHPKEGVLEVLKIRNERITATPEREVNCPISECTWLPTVEQIKEMVISRNLFNVEHEEKVIDPENFYKTPEEKWLTAYIVEQYEGKFWFAPESEWKDKKEKGS